MVPPRHCAREIKGMSSSGDCEILTEDHNRPSEESSDVTYGSDQ